MTLNPRLWPQNSVPPPTLRGPRPGRALECTLCPSSRDAVWSCTVSGSWPTWGASLGRPRWAQKASAHRADGRGSWGLPEARRRGCLRAVPFGRHAEVTRKWHLGLPCLRHLLLPLPLEAGWQGHPGRPLPQGTAAGDASLWGTAAAVRAGEAGEEGTTVRPSPQGGGIGHIHSAQGLRDPQGQGAEDALSEASVARPRGGVCLWGRARGDEPATRSHPGRQAAPRRPPRRGGAQLSSVKRSLIRLNQRKDEDREATPDLLRLGLCC